MAAAIEKARRQRAILDLLRERAIGSQDDLRRALRRERFPVTQATLSRDLNELRIVRVPMDEGYRYLPPDAVTRTAAAAPEPARRKLGSVAALEVTGIDSNEAVIIVRTLTGRAQGVAVYLDGVRLPEVLGTVAGDDTILVIPRSIKKTAALRAKLAELLGLE